MRLYMLEYLFSFVESKSLSAVATMSVVSD